MLLPAIGAGKVKVGQKVNIRLDNYPYMEFGMLEGRIANISDIPDQGMYYATVVFPDGLITSYGKALVFTQRLNGTAEIITNDIRLLHRILQPLKHILFEKT
jgi:HlyD family secretion protein